MLELGLIEPEKGKYRTFYQQWSVTALLAVAWLVVGISSDTTFLMLDGMLALLFCIGMGVQFYEMSEAHFLKSTLSLTATGFSLRYKDGRKTIDYPLQDVEYIQMPTHISSYRADPEWVVYSDPEAMQQRFESDVRKGHHHTPLYIRTRDGLLGFRVVFKNRREVATFQELMGEWRGATKVVVGNKLPVPSKESG